MDTSSIVESPDRRTYSRQSADFKACVVVACRQPGVSIALVALVALTNGLNVNFLLRWIIETERVGTTAANREDAAATDVLTAAGSLLTLRRRADAGPTRRALRAQDCHRTLARTDKDRHARASIARQHMRVNGHALLINVGLNFGMLSRSKVCR
jgi:transposase-like protein